MYAISTRAVARPVNLGVLVILCGEKVSPLVEIGLNDLPKTGAALPPLGDWPENCHNPLVFILIMN